MNNITCPHCHHEFDATASIQDHIRKELESEYHKKLDEQLDAHQKQSLALQKEREEFENKKRKENDIFQENLNKKISEERLKIKDSLNKENAQAMAQIQEELNDKNKKLAEAKSNEAKISRLEREKDELRVQIELEGEQRLQSERKRIVEEVQRQEAERSDLIRKELEKQLEDQKKLTNEMIRKQEQGSMQMQGEVQELAIEEWLGTNFPLDQILEVKKGQRGADCTQVVNDRLRTNCGRIYYESKRTKEFGGDWIEKLKADMRTQPPGLGVIVTQTMPKGMERMGQKDGVWICTFEEFKALSYVLRENVLAISNALATQENKGDKIVLLYDYMTGPQFRAHVEAIVEAFTSMKDDLEKEKRAVMTTWEKRGAKLDKVLNSTTSMYGTIKGIGGAQIGEVKEFELPE